MLGRVVLPLVIAALGLLFFSALVVHPAQVLYSDSSDLLVLHVPPERFLVRSWHQTGEVPLWCPYSFAGMPFAHDMQVAAFYPMHLPLYLLPEEWVAVALSWLVVVHVIVAGWCMYAYARSQGLRFAGALVAAVGFMFSGKWMIHLLVAGHYMSVGLAWLPLVLLALEGAISQRSLLRATWAGGAFALVVLGTHPQWTLYAGLFVALWTLAPALEDAGYWGDGALRSWRRTAAALGRWLGYGVWTVLVAIALSSVQLLPALEAASQSLRGHNPPAGSELAETVVSIVGLVGPALAGAKDRYDWEVRGGLGVVWVTAALMAPLLGRGRVRFHAGVGLALFVFALGGGNLLHGVPGFRLFPMQMRMLLIVTLPVALLAGTTVDALLSAHPEGSEPRRLGRRYLLEVTLFALFSLVIMALVVEVHHFPFQAYWASLVVTVPATYWLLGRRPRPPNDSNRNPGHTPRHAWLVAHRSWLEGRPDPLLSLAWLSVLLTDLWALAWPEVSVRPEAEIYAPPACVRYVVEHNAGRDRVLDRSVPADMTWTPLGPALSVALGIEQLRGYNPLDVERYKQYLQFISDRDVPLRAHRMMGSFPIKNKSLLDLLGTRFLIQPSDNPIEPNEEAPIDSSPLWRKVYEDPHPRVFTIFGGFMELPPFSVYENRAVYPRAFVVPEAAPFPDRAHALQVLKSNDFRRRVLLEDYEPSASAPASSGAFRPARVREYLPNRVRVDVDGSTPGYLVLTDIWFPGWTCTVDGRPSRLYRGDFLFRAVYVPAGSHTVVFRMAPVSYRRGKLISCGALAALVGGMLAGGIGRLRRRTESAGSRTGAGHGGTGPLSRPHAGRGDVP